MNKGRSIKREKLPKDIISLIKRDRKNFGSDNAQRIAFNINPRTYKYVVECNEARTDVLDKLKSYFEIKN